MVKKRTLIRIVIATICVFLLAFVYLFLNTEEHYYTVITNEGTPVKVVNKDGTKKVTDYSYSQMAFSKNGDKEISFRAGKNKPLPLGSTVKLTLKFGKGVTYYKVVDSTTPKKDGVNVDVDKIEQNLGK